MSTRKKYTRGTALLYVIALMAVMSLGLATSWKYLFATMDYAAQQRQEDAARRLAESGACAAISALAQGQKLESIPFTDFSEGGYAVKLQQNGNTHSIEARGFYGSAAPYAATHTLVAKVVLDASGKAQILRWSELRP